MPLTITENHSCIICHHAGNSTEVHPSQDESVNENGDDVPTVDQANCDGEELPSQDERAGGTGDDAGEDVPMEDQNDHDEESIHQQDRAHTKKIIGKLRATTFKNTSSARPQVSVLYFILSNYLCSLATSGDGAATNVDSQTSLQDRNSTYIELITYHTVPLTCFLQGKTTMCKSDPKSKAPTSSTTTGKSIHICR